MSLVDKGKDLAKLEKSFDVDSTDRIKYVYTNVVLIGAAFFVFNSSYVGQPVQCWIPKQMKGGWEDYIETYCLIENTYFVSMNETHLPKHNEREGREMVYYQWVPFILVIMAFFVYLPRLLWTACQKYIGVDLPAITVDLRKAARQGAEASDNLALFASKYQGRFGSKLSISLMVTKLLSIIVLIGQLVFLNGFLGPQYPMWGVGVLTDMLKGRHWQESGHFPRVTFCDVQVREMGGVVNNWTLQCVLMVNMFNEKIFIFLWWWLVVLVFISVINLLSWFYRTSMRSNNVSFVKDLLEINGIKPADDEVDYFVKTVLKTDGCVLLRLVADNATIFKAADYVRPLWTNYDRGQPRKMF